MRELKELEYKNNIITNSFVNFFLRSFRCFVYTPLSYVYWLIAIINRKVYLKAKEKQATTLIVLGSLKSGGGFRSALSLSLAQKLYPNKQRFAILCLNYQAFDIRAYFGRKKIQKNPNFKTNSALKITNQNKEQYLISDEALMMFENSSVDVFICQNRYLAWQELSNNYNYDYIISDGGLEDHRLAYAHTILINDTNNEIENNHSGDDQEPHKISDLLPSGKFRSFKHQHPHINQEWFFNPKSNQKGFRLSEIIIENYLGQSFNKNIDSNNLTAPETTPPAKSLTLVTGIGEPKRLIKDLNRLNIFPYHTLIRPNHDPNFDFHVKKQLSDDQHIILMTLKDYARLSVKNKENSNIYVIKQEFIFNFDLKESISQAL